METMIFFSTALSSMLRIMLSTALAGVAQWIGC